MRKNYLPIAEVATIILLACVPLFVTFPYRVNIFLSWEGAYRVGSGQLPFRDFGTPLGGMYWVIPGLFFKIFGSQMITLVKAQVFINIISGLAFRSILKSCKVEPGIRFVSVLLYCVSFSFFNFWPWYNHTVIVYELVGISFLLKAITRGKNKWTIPSLVLAAFFTCCSFLTKQDAGGMALMLCIALLIYSCSTKKKWMPLYVYVGSFFVILFLFIAPFLQYHFGYWFNHGQPPHTGRISLFEILGEFFGGSFWIKFYLLLMGILLLIKFRTRQQLKEDPSTILFAILTIGIIGEAVIFQVTSYTPPDNNIFFHSFAIAFILSMLAKVSTINFNQRSIVLICTIGIMLWWSQVFWKYAERIAGKIFPANTATISPTGENIVNKNTYLISNDTADIPESQWILSPLKSFKNIKMPSATVAGIDRVLHMDVVRQISNPHILNMTELTPLAVEIPFKLEQGSEFPLWYHLGVGMFNKQAEMFEKKISNKEYDLVLFEYVRGLNNFYPFRIRDSLMVHYRRVDAFPAPRRGEETAGTIEVYVK